MRCKLTLLILSGCIGIMQAQEKTKIGPFRSMLLRVVKCENTTYPLFDEPPMNLNIEIYNTSKKYFLMRGNLTVTKEVKNIKIQVRTYVWENNKWSMFYFINNMGCHGKMLAMVLTMFHIKYDSQSCTFLKGKYNFRNIDMNRIQHSVVSAVEYGRVMWRNELTAGPHTIYCWQFEANVVPDV